MKLWSYALFGFSTGNRSMLASALAARVQPPVTKSPRTAALISNGLALGALGELVADKLPTTPPRTQPPSFAVRVLIGAAGSAFLARRAGGSWVVPGLIGGVGAIGGTLAGARWRTLAAKRFGADWPGALAEDAAAAGLALAALRT